MRKLPKTNFTLRKSEPWIQNAPFESNFYHAISLMLPAYEKAMIAFCCEERKVLKSELEEEVKLFIRQEEGHRRIHAQYNKRLTEAGYRVDFLIRISQWNVTLMNRLFPVPFKIAIAAAGEHLTHLIAVYYLSHYDRYKTVGDLSIAELWHWHVIEEIEHRSAMHNLNSTHKFAYMNRVLAYLAVCFWLVFPYALLGAFALAFQDRSLFSLRYWSNMLSTFLGRNGLFYLIVTRSLGYASLNFHPESDKESRHYVDEYDAAQEQLVDSHTNGKSAGF